MKRLVLIALPLIALAIFGGRATAASTTLSCNPPSHLGGDNPNMGNLETRALTCRAAQGAIARGHLSERGNLISKGVTCRITHRYHSGGVTLGANISCRKGNGSFSFSWGT